MSSAASGSWWERTNWHSAKLLRENLICRPLARVSSATGSPRPLQSRKFHCAPDTDTDASPAGTVRYMVIAAGSVAGGLVLIALGLGLYFTPSIVAGARNVPHRGSVIVVNVFLGWTLVGWVVALAK